MSVTVSRRLPPHAPVHNHKSAAVTPAKVQQLETIAQRFLRAKGPRIISSSYKLSANRRSITASKTLEKGQVINLTATIKKDGTIHVEREIVNKPAKQPRPTQPKPAKRPRLDPKKLTLHQRDPIRPGFPDVRFFLKRPPNRPS